MRGRDRSRGRGSLVVRRKLFPIVAAVFGTHRYERIINRLSCGTRRAVALQRYLRARAERGLEIPEINPYRSRDAGEGLAPAPPLGQSDGQSDGRSGGKRPPRSAGTPLINVTYTVGPDHPYRFYLPSMKELAKEMRRVPVGQTIMAIGLDFGIIPSFCTGAFASCLNDVENWFGVNGMVAGQVLEQRQESFLKERNREQTVPPPRVDPSYQLPATAPPQAGSPEISSAGDNPIRRNAGAYPAQIVLF